MKLKFGLPWRMQDVRNTCLGLLLTGSGTSPSVRKCVTVNKVEQNWRSDESLDIRNGDTEYGVCSAGFWSCFGIVFSCYVTFHMFWNANVCTVSLYVGSM